ncbi:NFX1-type zinc finger-containing protein 1-like [Arctopsyche grandis]|uniref:NFX1-type zinc finger-containing protein 1-like n=1 Tax=Arctopsyche grandis TaxID=121162 RepID=UPI00406D9EF1
MGSKKDMFEINELLNLVNLNSADIYLRFMGDMNKFENTLEYCSMKSDHLVLFVECVAKMCDDYSIEKILIYFKIESNSVFENTLKKFLLCVPYEGFQENSIFWTRFDRFWTSILKYCEHYIAVMRIYNFKSMDELLKIMILSLQRLKEKRDCFDYNALFESIKNIQQHFNNIEDIDPEASPIENIESNKKIKVTDVIADKKVALSDVKTNIKTKVADVIPDKKVTLSNVKTKNKKKNINKEPPNNFRELSIKPVVEEITSKKAVFLRKNIVDGEYYSVDHYLDIQFRLLKEDYMRTVRTAIQSFRGNPNRVHEGGRFYHCTKLKYYKSSNIRVGILVYIDKRRNRIQFDDSSANFKSGSLLLFSKDNFKSWFFGTVMDSDRYLRESTILVNFEDVTFTTELFKDNYVMFESNAFYAFYFSILSSLKNTEELPMQNWILKSLVTSELPAYVKSYYKIGSNIVDMKNNVGWPKAESIGLDKFQYEAYKTALSRKCVTIQGPPGTGKTYIALKIVQAILSNITESERPILVLACSNFALDQFLTGILKITSEVIRIGSQSKVEELNNDKNIRRQRIKNEYSNEIHYILSLIEKVSCAILIVKGQGDITELKKLPKSFKVKTNLFEMQTKEAMQEVAKFLESFDYNQRNPKLNELKELLHKLMELLYQEHKCVLLDYENFRSDTDIEILRKADVVGITTTAAAMKKSLFDTLQPKIVIIEEAAQVLESHVVVNLNIKCDHVILIGDQQQLRPAVASYKLAKDYNFDVSLFERMAKGENFCQLVTQHRMRPEISTLLTPSIYKDLRNDLSVFKYPAVEGVSENVYFFDHKFPESRNMLLMSYNNEQEAAFAISFAQYLIIQGYEATEITILSMYKKQVMYLEELRASTETVRNIDIQSVDSYQGLENKIIILCLVRNNSKNIIGFLKTSNRLCVALSRAKEGLFILGNAGMLVSNSELWFSIINKLEMKGCIGNFLPLYCQHHGTETKIFKSADFKNIYSGICKIKPHEELCDLKHKFKIECFRGAKCEKIVEKTFECGHSLSVPCYVDSKKASCMKICSKNNKSCKASHPCPGVCFHKCELCSIQVKVEKPCGHTVFIECYKNDKNRKCYKCVQRFTL